MVAIRTILYIYPMRLPLLVLFFLIIILSIVLTIISLNEHMESSRLWQILVDKSDLNRLPNSARNVENTASNFSMDSAYRVTQNGKQKKISRMLKMKQFKSKMSQWRLALLRSKNNTDEQGWKVLPGEIVIHDGEFDNPHKFAYLTNAIESCKNFFDDFGTEKNVNILIFVESDVKNGDRRQIIRETWALPMLQKALNFKVVFMLGAARASITQDIVNEEFYAYGDIVQENFTESFKHLTLKSVMGLKWTQTYCPEADFVVKTDDDIIIHVPNLVQVLLKMRGKKHVLLCHKNRSRQIIRNGSSFQKYQVSQHELPGNYFPSYCAGFFYVVSRNTAQKLYAASTRTPYFFIEDVYITGFCRHKAGITLVDHPHIALRPQVTPAQASCHFSEGRITSQELDQDEMKRIWKAMNTRGFFCPVPVSRNKTSTGR